MAFDTASLADAEVVVAPDGSEVRPLAQTSRGSLAHFRLNAGAVSLAVRHRSVEELWYIVAGSGRMWRADAGAEQVVALRPGVALSIPAGVAFQFRADAAEPLEAVGTTMPPWPGDDEASSATGPWTPTV
jgi:mannose-6-phosphate isomerase-like protein (cupin superfamily)